MTSSDNLWQQEEHEEILHQLKDRLTLVMKLKHADGSLWRRAVEHRDGIGWTADHLTFHQECLIGKNKQSSAFIHPSDWQLLALWQVDTFHLQYTTHVMYSIKQYNITLVV